MDIDTFMFWSHFLQAVFPRLGVLTPTLLPRLALL
jgi:hypothetical protein